MQRNHYMPLFVVCVAGLIAGLAFRAPMLLDDLDQIGHISNFSSVSQCLGLDCYDLFRPIKNLLYWIILHQPFSPNLVAHCLSGALFIISGLMVYVWLRLWFSSSYLSAVGAVLWCWAPTVVSSVAWFSCVNILVSVVFALGSLCLWERSRRHADHGWGKASAFFLIAASCSYVAAFFAYEQAIVIPVLCLLQDMSCGRKILNRASSAFWAAAVLLVITSLLVRQFSDGAETLDNPYFGPMSDAELVATAPFIFFDHVMWWVFPFGRQEILGTFVSGESATPIQISLSWVALLFLLALSAMSFRKAPRIAFGMLWVVLALIPVCNFLPFRNGPFADYFLTLPSMGIVYLLLEAIRFMQASCSKKLLAYTLTATVVLWRGSATVTAAQWAKNWWEPEELYRTCMDSRNHPFAARANLALCLIQQGNVDEAEPLARQSVQEAPWYPFAYNVLGDALNRQGRHAEAYQVYAAAVSNNATDALTHFALAYTAETYFDDPQTAARHYAIVTTYGMTSVIQERAYACLARLKGLDNDIDGAINTYQQGLSIYPNSVLLHHGISVAYGAHGDDQLALMHREKVRRLKTERVKEENSIQSNM